MCTQTVTPLCVAALPLLWVLMMCKLQSTSDYDIHAQPFRLVQTDFGFKTTQCALCRRLWYCVGPVWCYLEALLRLVTLSELVPLCRARNSNTLPFIDTEWTSSTSAQFAMLRIRPAESVLNTHAHKSSHKRAANLARFESTDRREAAWTNSTSRRMMGDNRLVFSSTPSSMLPGTT
jgi:hypothetical protein